MSQGDEFSEWFALTETGTEIDGTQARIQWKGTSVCMDVTCACGEGTHLDADFAYTIACGACGRVYGVSPFVRLVPVEDPRLLAWLRAGGACEIQVTACDDPPEEL
jgi:hypothetical protein